MLFVTSFSVSGLLGRPPSLPLPLDHVCRIVFPDIWRSYNIDTCIYLSPTERVACDLSISLIAQKRRKRNVEKYIHGWKFTHKSPRHFFAPFRFTANFLTQCSSLPHRNHGMSGVIWTLSSFSPLVILYPATLLSQNLIWCTTPWIIGLFPQIKNNESAYTIRYTCSGNLLSELTVLIAVQCKMSIFLL